MDSDGSCYVFDDADNDGIYRTDETADYKLDVTDTGYQITTKNDIIHTFNDFGQLIKTAEPNG